MRRQLRSTITGRIDRVDSAAPAAASGAALATGCARSSFNFSSQSRTKYPTQTRQTTELDEVETRTRSFRKARAREHERSAHRARLEHRDGAVAFHQKRVRGQIERFDRVRECRAADLVTACGDCGHEQHRRRTRCGCHRLCESCADHRATVLRTRFRVGHGRVLGDKATQELLERRRVGERLLTLTAPHSGSLDRDVSVLQAAWPHFKKLLDRFCVEEAPDVAGQVAFVRVLEVGPGTTKHGHAHFHVYLMSPYLPEELVRHIWGRALQKCSCVVPLRPLGDVLVGTNPAHVETLRRWLVTRRGSRGKPVAMVFWPIIWISSVAGKNVDVSLIPYLTKTAGPATPDLRAAIYRATENVRTIAASRGFFVKEVHSRCCSSCGSTALRKRRAASQTSSDGDLAP
jgi:hypothetical protein